MYKSGAAQYQSINNQSAVMDADPHRLIQLLMEAGLARITSAKAAIERASIEERNQAINKAIAIISGLQESLDMKAGEVAENLDRLYEYMVFRLFEANRLNDPEMLNEVHKLLSDIKSAWDAIRESAMARTESAKQA